MNTSRYFSDFQIIFLLLLFFLLFSKTDMRIYVKIVMPICVLHNKSTRMQALLWTLLQPSNSTACCVATIFISASLHLDLILCCEDTLNCLILSKLLWNSHLTRYLCYWLCVSIASSTRMSNNLKRYKDEHFLKEEREKDPQKTSSKSDKQAKALVSWAF